VEPPPVSDDDLAFAGAILGRRQAPGEDGEMYRRELICSWHRLLAVVEPEQ
jgi:hypothetical protein